MLTIHIVEKQQLFKLHEQYFLQTFYIRKFDFVAAKNNNSLSLSQYSVIEILAKMSL
jgi:hypothetical protein